MLQKIHGHQFGNMGVHLVQDVAHTILRDVDRQLSEVNARKGIETTILVFTTFRIRLLW